MSGQYAGDLSSPEAWELLERDPQAVLIDVRTEPEWRFVGVPDPSGIEKLCRSARANAEALAGAGVLAYRAGRPDVAESLLARAAFAEKSSIDSYAPLGITSTWTGAWALMSRKASA